MFASLLHEEVLGLAQICVSSSNNKVGAIYIKGAMILGEFFDAGNWCFSKLASAFLFCYKIGSNCYLCFFWYAAF